MGVSSSSWGIPKMYRRSCRFFLATFKFHITLASLPWNRINYNHWHLNLSLSNFGYPNANHHHRPATAAAFSVGQWCKQLAPLSPWHDKDTGCALAGRDAAGIHGHIWFNQKSKWFWHWSPKYKSPWWTNMTSWVGLHHVGQVLSVW